MDESTAQVIPLEDIKRRSVVGVVTLTSRTFILQIISLVATFILTILLDPATFGIFFVVTAAVNFLNYFSDIGLAAALIQKKEEPTRSDLVTTFTIQQCLVGTAVIIALLLSSWVARFFNLGTDGIFLFQSLTIAFLLSSLKTIPSILLERKLEFHKLIPAQIIETVSFYVTAIFLASRGMGVASFAWAALARGVSGTITLYLIAPWRPGFAIDKKSARHLLSFGIPFQANSFLALIKDDLMTIFLGKFLPFSAIGYIGWAKKWAEIALRLIMDNIIKVTFPAFSRLQHDPKLLSKAIEKSVLFLALLTFPIAVGMMFMIQPFIEVVPAYLKWQPAVISFYLFTISSILATLSSPLVNALNALGKVRYTFYLMVLWTTLTWTFIPLGIHFFGFNGVAASAVLIGFTSFVPIFFLKKVAQFSFFRQLTKPLIATVCMTVAVALSTAVIQSALIKLIVGVLSGAIVYGAVTYALMGRELRAYFYLFSHKTG